jgi:diadenosine tetraphosphate (Ap4A) HIT family hydrolase
MTRKFFSETVRPHIELRRCILLKLYGIFKEYPYAPMELKELKEECRTNPKDLNWNIVYLEKCGYVELGRAYEGVTYVAPSAAITPAGIDLIENEREFNRRFPEIISREQSVEDDPLPEFDPDCPFCSDNIKSRIVEEFDSVFAVEDQYPVTPGHLLVITRRHTRDLFTMTPQEKKDAERLLEILQKRILEKDFSASGFNVGVNCGVSAGQTIMHAHIHLIPRRDGDIPNPAGGVRGVIPERRAYGDRKEPD